jgi:hypothetical protein
VEEAKNRHYLVLGDEEGTKEFCVTSWGVENPPNATRIVHNRDLEAARGMLRDYDLTPIILLVPGWARTPLLNEATLYHLAALDGVGV